MPFSTRLKAAIEALQKGEMVILVDSEDRENEGDLVLAAEFATAEKVNFFIREACGLVCLSLEAKKIDELGLPPMVSENQSPRKTAFTVSIEASTGVSTGISAQDRAHTIRVAANPASTKHDLVSPGHIFPLRAVEGGVLARPGHTEGSIELCKLAGLIPAAVICEIINEDGTMARKPDLESFAAKHSIPIVTIEEIIVYRAIHESWIKASATAKFPTRFGKVLEVQSFKNELTKFEHMVLKTPELKPDADHLTPTLVRIHSECLTGDALGSLRCDCGFQLQSAIEQISAVERGLVIYLKNQEGRGIGLFNKIESYALQDQGRDTLDANLELGFHPDLRHYHEAGKILLELGIKRIRLLTNNPQKSLELKQFGIEVVEQIPLSVPQVPENAKYLKTKRDRFHHTLTLEGNA